MKEHQEGTAVPCPYEEGGHIGPPLRRATGSPSDPVDPVDPVREFRSAPMKRAATPGRPYEDAAALLRRATASPRDPEDPVDPVRESGGCV